MMFLPLLLAAQAVTGPPTPPQAKSDETRYDLCLERAASDPAAGEAEAGRWRLEGGGFFAGQCLGIAYANEQRWPAAAGAFEGAAAAAEKAHDARAAKYWAQAGNAWLAGGDADKARAALDAALAGGTLTGLQLGEAHLDRARALVAGGDLKAARGDLDHALGEAAGDPLAWLLSATLARKTGDLPRARTDIAQALTLGSDDSAVQLEAGNIAALGGDAVGARRAWEQAARLQPQTPAAKSASAALAQFKTE